MVFMLKQIRQFANLAFLEEKGESQMKLMLCAFLSVVVCLSLISPAWSSVEWTYGGSKYGIRRGNPIPVGSSENLVSFILTAYKVDPTASNPTTFDGTSGDKTGITGTLHQEQFFNRGTQTITPDIDSSLEVDIDSYFLVSLDDITIISTLTETLVPDNSMESPQFIGDITGFGESLNGAFALTGGNLNAEWDFAKIVAPADSIIQFNARISGGGEGEDFNMAIPAPEPTSVSLLAVGALALWRRRK
jgi:hypothetical protein